jgi:hypothetical protein
MPGHSTILSVKVDRVLSCYSKFLTFCMAPVSRGTVAAFWAVQGLSYGLYSAIVQQMVANVPVGRGYGQRGTRFL